MSSQRKIDSARANGAKSHGPKTEEGRQRSSMNALTHGFYAASVVLPHEPLDQYHETLQAYVRQFQPDGQAEFDLIEEMLAAKWRQRRLWAIEADLFTEEMNSQKERLDKNEESYDEITPLTQAYRFRAAESSLPFLVRQESSLERAYSRALRNLLQLQRLRKAAQPPTNSNSQERTQSHDRTPQPSAPSPQPPATHLPPPRGPGGASRPVRAS